MSAFIVGKAHIDYLVTAGLRLSQTSSLRWTVPGEFEPGDHQRGAPWGPTAIVSYEKQMRELTPETADTVGAMLLKENYRSVHHRYDELPEVEADSPYRFEESRHRVEPVQVLSAIACYRYQSCEHPGWTDSEAWDFCHALQNQAIRRLPGWEEAMWEIPP